MIARYIPYTLDFIQPAGTSRGILNQKKTFFLIIEDKGRYGIGECGMFKGLSCDDLPDFEAKLQWACDHIYLGLDSLFESLRKYPAIQFGLEQAFLSLSSNNPFELFKSPFTEREQGQEINGLIWMGDYNEMKNRIDAQLKKGFKTLKMKVGAIDFENECLLLKKIRERYTENDLIIRVDANGAFTPAEAMTKLSQLSTYQLHSIEQPIRQGQLEEMRDLITKTPLPIALDEELIGVHYPKEKNELISFLNPQFIILKPTLVGGFMGSQEWIEVVNENSIPWWVTSALESNIGLNAIAQWTATLNNPLPQGLGTGSLFTNNIESPIEVSEGKLYYRKNKKWIINQLIK